MMQRKKNIQLLISLILLLTVAIVLVTTRGQKSRLEIKEDYFSLEDVSKIDQVELVREGETLRLQFEGGRWLINSEQQAEPQMMDVLFAVVNQIRVKRPVASAQREAVQADMTQKGVRVRLKENGKIVKEVWVVGNTSRTATYLAETKEAKPFLVGIPGYQSYIGGIFELSESDWYNRLVFPINWRNLQSLLVKLPAQEQENFTIAYGEVFFEVKELAQTDTSRLADFIDEVSMLRVDNYLSPKHSEFDSISRLSAERIIEVVQIGGRTRSLEILPLEPGSRERLVRMSGGLIGVMDNRRLQGIWVSKDKFVPEGDLSPNGNRE
jgi:hypothetical protein